MRRIVILLVMIACRAVAFATDTEAGKWDRSIAVGYEKKSGNTDKTSFTLNLATKIDTEKMRWTFDGTMNYGKTDDEKDADKGKATTEYRYKFVERMYATAFGAAEYDKMANLDYRYIPGIGVGYTVYRSDIQELSVNIGPTYLMEKYTDQKKNDYYGAKLALDFNGQLTSGVKYWAKGTYIVRADDSDNYLLNGEIGVGLVFA